MKMVPKSPNSSKYNGQRTKGSVSAGIHSTHSRATAQQCCIFLKIPVMIQQTNLRTHHSFAENTSDHAMSCDCTSMSLASPLTSAKAPGRRWTRARSPAVGQGAEPQLLLARGGHSPGSPSAGHLLPSPATSLLTRDEALVALSTPCPSATTAAGRGCLVGIIL